MGYKIKADVLKCTRVFSGMTRGELAKKVGISTTAMRNHENGTMTPQPKIVKQYCNVLGIEPQDLVIFEND